MTVIFTIIIVFSIVLCFCVLVPMKNNM